MSSVSSISVVVPVYNQAGILESTVPAVVAMQGVNEIVFVDDGSTDESARIIEGLLPPGSRARLASHATNLGRSAARNTGIRESSGDIVLFLDADIVPEPDAAESAARLFEDDAVVGVLLNDQPDELDASDPFHRYLMEVSGPTGSPWGEPLHFKYFISGHSAVRRKALESVGGLDAEISYGEDLELAYRLQRAFPNGLRLAPDAVVHQRDVGDLDERLSRLHEFGKNLTLLRRKHPGLIEAADLGFVDSPLHRPLASRMVPRLCRIALPFKPWWAQRTLIRLILVSAILRGYREGV